MFSWLITPSLKSLLTPRRSGPSIGTVRGQSSYQPPTPNEGRAQGQGQGPAPATKYPRKNKPFRDNFSVISLRCRGPVQLAVGFGLVVAAAGPVSIPSAKDFYQGHY